MVWWMDILHDLQEHGCPVLHILTRKPQYKMLIFRLVIGLSTQKVFHPSLANKPVINPQQSIIGVSKTVQAL